MLVDRKYWYFTLSGNECRTNISCRFIEIRVFDTIHVKASQIMHIEEAFKIRLGIVEAFMLPVFMFMVSPVACCVLSVVGASNFLPRAISTKTTKITTIIKI